MAVTASLGLIPAGLIGVLVYTGGLFALRIINRDELRALTHREDSRPPDGTDPAEPNGES